MRSQLALVLCIAACGDNLDPSSDEELAGRTLTGSKVAHYRAASGTLLFEDRDDLYDTIIEAHIPDGDGFRVRGGTGHRDGSFVVDDLPDGPVWLRVAPRTGGEAFYWTDAEHISFDEDILGPYTPRQADEGDTVRLDIDGLAAWDDTDELAWFVPEDIVFQQNVVSSTPPTAGTTDLDGLTVDWTGLNMADAGPTDPSLLIQYRTSELAPGVAVRAPVRAAQVAVSQRAGEETTLATTLVAPPALPYRLAWSRDVFEAQRTAVHPSRAGESYAHAFYLSAIPALVDGRQWISVEYNLASLADPSIVEGTTPLDLGELQIPNPFPREWLADSYVVTFPVEFPLPDGTPATLDASIGRRSTALASAAAPAAPVITPVRGPTIAGRSAHGMATGVGTSPTVAWTPPAIGTATSHSLRVIQAFTDPPPPFRPGWYIVADLVVPGDVASVRLPADLLREGNTYGIVMKTLAQPGQDVRTDPYTTRGDAGFAETILGPFTP